MGVTGLTELPPDCFMHVMSFCGVRDIFALASTCRGAFTPRWLPFDLNFCLCAKDMTFADIDTRFSHLRALIFLSECSKHEPKRERWFAAECKVLAEDEVMWRKFAFAKWGDSVILPASTEDFKKPWLRYCLHRLSLRVVRCDSWHAWEAVTILPRSQRSEGVSVSSLKQESLHVRCARDNSGRDLVFCKRVQILLAGTNPSGISKRVRHGEG